MIRYRILERTQDGYVEFYPQFLVILGNLEESWVNIAGPYTRLIEAEQFLRRNLRTPVGEIKERIHRFNPQQLLD